jgi:hypothetical protein
MIFQSVVPKVTHANDFTNRALLSRCCFQRKDTVVLIMLVYEFFNYSSNSFIYFSFLTKPPVAQSTQNQVIKLLLKTKLKRIRQTLCGHT